MLENLQTVGSKYGLVKQYRRRNEFNDLSVSDVGVWIICEPQSGKEVEAGGSASTGSRGLECGERVWDGSS